MISDEKQYEYGLRNHGSYWSSEGCLQTIPSVVLGDRCLLKLTKWKSGYFTRQKMHICFCVGCACLAGRRRSRNNGL